MHDLSPFDAWLAGMRRALAGTADADVPCGACTACCTSGQFVHIGPHETATLARIPASLLFPAPGLPDGHVVLGYEPTGRCPMLVDGACSIYEDRPRTCRTYDCRVFVAAGVLPDKPAIAARVAAWPPFEGDDGSVRRAAERVSAADPSVPPTGVAVLALREVLRR